MELNKNNMKKIMVLITASLAVFWCLNHLPILFQVIDRFMVIISPFLIGLCFAFIINILLRKLEGLWNRMPVKYSGRLERLRRPVCLSFSIILIFSVIFIILFMVIPEIQRNILTIAEMFPQRADDIADWWDSIVETALNYSIVLPDADFNGNEIGKMIGGFLYKTVDITVSIVTVVVNVVLGLVFVLYVMSQKENLSRQVRKLLFAVLPTKRVGQIMELAELSGLRKYKHPETV